MLSQQALLEAAREFDSRQHQWLNTYVSEAMFFDQLLARSTRTLARGGGRRGRPVGGGGGRSGW